MKERRQYAMAYRRKNHFDVVALRPDSKLRSLFKELKYLNQLEKNDEEKLDFKRQLNIFIRRQREDLPKKESNN